jgi:hypothetical protein
VKFLVLVCLSAVAIWIICWFAVLTVSAIKEYREKIEHRRKMAKALREKELREILNENLTL